MRYLVARTQTGRRSHAVVDDPESSQRLHDTDGWVFKRTACGLDTQVLLTQHAFDPTSSRACRRCVASVRSGWEEQ